MKRKRLNPEQWSLERCVEYTVKALGDEDRKALIDGIHFDWHSSLGRWIRNNCGLWKLGTNRCVDDIVREYKSGKLSSKYLDDNQFTHSQLFFDLKNTDTKTIRKIDCTLEHPDNCSAVIIEVVIQRLVDGTD